MAAPEIRDPLHCWLGAPRRRRAKKAHPHAHLHNPLAHCLTNAGLWPGWARRKCRLSMSRSWTLEIWPMEARVALARETGTITRFPLFALENNINSHNANTTLLK